MPKTQNKKPILDENKLKEKGLVRLLKNPNINPAEVLVFIGRIYELEKDLRVDSVDISEDQVKPNDSFQTYDIFLNSKMSLNDVKKLLDRFEFPEERQYKTISGELKVDFCLRNKFLGRLSFLKY